MLEEINMNNDRKHGKSIIQGQTFDTYFEISLSKWTEKRLLHDAAAFS